jgi:hypothetical protein
MADCDTGSSGIHLGRYEEKILANLENVTETVEAMEQAIIETGKCPYCSGKIELDKSKDRLRPHWRCVAVMCPKNITWQIAPCVGEALRVLCGIDLDELLKSRKGE